MSAFDDVAALPPLPIWEGLVARAVHGERITLAVVEVEPDAPPNEPHRGQAGSDGAVVVDVFGPPRADWGTLSALEDQPPRWP
jgi:hypothetical protein